MLGAERFCSHARHWFTHPMSSGAASTTKTDCRSWKAIPGRFDMRLAYEHEQEDQGHEAVEQIRADPSLLQPADQRGQRLHEPRDRQVERVPMPVLIFSVKRGAGSSASGSRRSIRYNGPNTWRIGCPKASAESCMRASCPGKPQSQGSEKRTRP